MSFIGSICQQHIFYQSQNSWLFSIQVPFGLNIDPFDVGHSSLLAAVDEVEYLDTCSLVAHAALPYSVSPSFNSISWNAIFNIWLRQGLLRQKVLFRHCPGRSGWIFGHLLVDHLCNAALISSPLLLRHWTKLWNFWALVRFADHRATQHYQSPLVSIPFPETLSSKLRTHRRRWVLFFFHFWSTTFLTYSDFLGSGSSYESESDSSEGFKHSSLILAVQIQLGGLELEFFLHSFRDSDLDPHMIILRSVTWVFTLVFHSIYSYSIDPRVLTPFRWYTITQTFSSQSAWTEWRQQSKPILGLYYYRD